MPHRACATFVHEYLCLRVELVQLLYQFLDVHRFTHSPKMQERRPSALAQRTLSVTWCCTGRSLCRATSGRV